MTVGRVAQGALQGLPYSRPRTSSPWRRRRQVIHSQTASESLFQRLCCRQQGNRTAADWACACESALHAQMAVNQVQMIAETSAWAARVHAAEAAHRVSAARGNHDRLLTVCARLGRS